jgi:hypothetical protein
MNTYDLSRPNNFELSYPHHLVHNKLANTIDLVTEPESIPVPGDQLKLQSGVLEVLEVVDSRPAKGRHRIENPIWLKVKYR